MVPPPAEGHHQSLVNPADDDDNNNISEEFCKVHHPHSVVHERRYDVNVNSSKSQLVLTNKSEETGNPILEYGFNNNNNSNSNSNNNESRLPITNNNNNNMNPSIPRNRDGKEPPTPLYLSQSEIDELYDMMEVLIQALDELLIPYSIMAGTLLGAVRSNSILFNDHDIDIAVIEPKKTAWNDDTICKNLQQKLPLFLEKQIKDNKTGHSSSRESSNSSFFEEQQSQISHDTHSTDQSPTEAAPARYHYHHRPTEICDRIKSTMFPNVWIDIFVLRKYLNKQDFYSITSTNVNDDSLESPPTPDCQTQYSKTIETLFRRDDITGPIYHYHRPKAIVSKPNDFMSPEELLPVQKVFSFGPLSQVSGPQMPVRILQRRFGQDCFTHYRLNNDQQKSKNNNLTINFTNFKLTDEFYLPVQHSSKQQNNQSQHNKIELDDYLAQQFEEEKQSMSYTCTDPRSVKNVGLTRTKSMGVSTSFHVKNLLQLETLSQTVDEYDYNEPTTKPSTKESTKFFGTAIQKHTNSSPDVPNFDKSLREVMESHIKKARLNRESCQQQLLEKIGLKKVVGSNQKATDLIIPYPILRNERAFLFDIETYPLHKILSKTLNIKDLSLLHENKIKDKKILLEPLLSKKLRRPFHECYDNFVTNFCIPLLHSIAMRENVLNTNRSSSNSHHQTICYRYQAFPCIRVIRPGDFSIGPHCDMAYGHSLGNINFHIPLTPTYGTNCLYTESHPRREDWHPLTAKSVGLGYAFDGARSIHFSLENTTKHTRVSLDFRIAISRKNLDPERLPKERRINETKREDEEDDGLLCGTDMLEDRFSAVSGYYDEAYIDVGNMEVFHYAPSPVYKKVTKDGRPKLIDPDKRVGFPF